MVRLLEAGQSESPGDSEKLQGIVDAMNAADTTVISRGELSESRATQLIQALEVLEARRI